MTQPGTTPADVLMAELLARIEALEEQLKRQGTFPGSSLDIVGFSLLSAPGKITFPASGNLPTAYRSLLVLGSVRSVRAGQVRDTLGVRFGTGGAVDSGANYSSMTTQVVNVTAGYTAVTTDTFGRCGQVEAATATASTQSGVFIFLPAYQAATHKQIQTLPSVSFADDAVANFATVTQSSKWRNTGAITSMQFAGGNAWDDLATGSFLTLLGMP